jgi:hypothetical protein
MNKTLKISITCIVILVTLVSTFGIMSGKPASTFQASEEYAILTYYPDTQVAYVIGRQGFSAKIFYGSDSVENIALTKEEVKNRPISNLVADLLGRLGQEGYTLISTSVVTTVQGPGMQSSRLNNEIHCFLKKVK